MTTLLKMLKSKIHRATVTHADLNYEGSITLPAELLEAAFMAPFEAVHVWNVTAGTRFETYTMLGERGSGLIAVNGAAARLVTPGDLVIIACFTWLDKESAKNHKPGIIFVDGQNRMCEIRPEKLPSALIKA